MRIDGGVKGDARRKWKLLDKQTEGDDARVWQCEHPAGGVHCGAADGGGVSPCRARIMQRREECAFPSQ